MVSAEEIAVDGGRLLILVVDRRKREDQQARAARSGAAGNTGTGTRGIQQTVELSLLVENVHRHRIDRGRVDAEGCAERGGGANVGQHGLRSADQTRNAVLLPGPLVGEEPEGVLHFRQRTADLSAELVL